MGLGWTYSVHVVGLCSVQFSFFLFFPPSLLIFSLLLRSMCSMHVIVHVSHICRCMGTLVNGDMGVWDMAVCNMGI